MLLAPASLALTLALAGPSPAETTPSGIADLGPRLRFGPGPVAPTLAGPSQAGSEGSSWQRQVRGAALFLGGSLSAFTLHEGGHLTANLAFGCTPHLEPVSFGGVIPFFSITSDVTCKGDRCAYRVNGGTAPFGAGRPGLYTILMGGFHMQHIEDELILTLDPELRWKEAPFRKGMLAFNTLTSIGYVVANWSGIEPEKGDLHGTYAMTGASQHLVNSMLLGVAVLDLARYAFPDARWLAWASRAAKLGLGGITFTL